LPVSQLTILLANKIIQLKIPIAKGEEKLTYIGIEHQQKQKQQNKAIA